MSEIKESSNQPAISLDVPQAGKRSIDVLGPTLNRGSVCCNTSCLGFRGK